MVLFFLSCLPAIIVSSFSVRVALSFIFLFVQILPLVSCSTSSSVCSICKIFCSVVRPLRLNSLRLFYPGIAFLLYSSWFPLVCQFFRHSNAETVFQSLVLPHSPSSSFCLHFSCRRIWLRRLLGRAAFLLFRHLYPTRGLPL